MRVPQFAGLILGVGSLAGILWLESINSGEKRWPGVLALLAAVVIHAVMYVLCKKRGQKVSVLTYNTLPCLGAGFLLLFLDILLKCPIPVYFQ